MGFTPLILPHRAPRSPSVSSAPDRLSEASSLAYSGFHCR